MYNTWEQIRGKGDMKLGSDKERWGRGGKTIHKKQGKDQGHELGRGWKGK